MSEIIRTHKLCVSAINANGEPDLYFCRVRCTDTQYDEGLHYEAAKDLATNNGYEPALAYDDTDSAGRALADLFQWETATVSDISGR